MFRRTLERDDKQELFIFITPRSADGTSPPELGGHGVPPLDGVEHALPAAGNAPADDHGNAAAAKDVVDAAEGETVGRTADSAAAAGGEDVPRDAVVVDVDTVPEPEADTEKREAVGDAYGTLFALAAVAPANDAAAETEPAVGPDGPAEAEERVLYTVFREPAACAVVSVRPGSLRGNAARMLRACGYALGGWPLKDDEHFRDWVVAEGFGADVEGVAGVVELVTGLTGYEIRASVAEANRVVDFAEVAR